MPFVFGPLWLASVHDGQAKANRPQASLFFHASKQKVPEAPVVLQLSKYTFRFRHSTYGQGITLLAPQDVSSLILVTQPLQTDNHFPILLPSFSDPSADSPRSSGFGNDAGEFHSHLGESPCSLCGNAANFRRRTSMYPGFRCTSSSQSCPHFLFNLFLFLCGSWRILRPLESLPSPDRRSFLHFRSLYPQSQPSGVSPESVSAFPDAAVQAGTGRSWV